MEWKRGRPYEVIDAEVEQAADLCFTDGLRTRREAARRKVLETNKVTGVTFDIVKRTDEGEGGTSLVVVEKGIKGFFTSNEYIEKPYTELHRFLFKKVGEDWLMSAVYAACRSCAAAGSCFNCEGSGREVCSKCEGNKACSRCEGAGKVEIGGGDCPACKGGKLCRLCEGEGGWKCRHCNNTGTCNPCGGKKWTQKDEFEWLRVGSFKIAQKSRGVILDLKSAEGALGTYAQFELHKEMERGRRKIAALRGALEQLNPLVSPGFRKSLDKKLEQSVARGRSDDSRLGLDVGIVNVEGGRGSSILVSKGNEYTRIKVSVMKVGTNWLVSRVGFQCGYCNGKKSCPSCKGSGKRACSTCKGEKSCSSCKGSGWVACFYCKGRRTCSLCDGVGWEDKP